MVSNTEPQRRYRQRCALTAGSDADTRRQRDTAQHRERQNQHRARLVLEERTHSPTFHLTTPHQIYKRVWPNMSTKTKLQLGAGTVPADFFMEVDAVLPTPPPAPPLPVDVRLGTSSGHHCVRQTRSSLLDHGTLASPRPRVALGSSPSVHSPPSPAVTASRRPPSWVCRRRRRPVPVEEDAAGPSSVFSLCDAGPHSLHLCIDLRQYTTSVHLDGARRPPSRSHALEAASPRMIVL
jgi:hypothetical protein